MLKRFINYFIVLCIIMIFLSGCSKKPENTINENENDTKISRTSTITNETNNTNTTENKPASPAPIGTEIGVFSTNILDKRENRQNNIRITCSKLNEFTVKSGETFSFCNTVGKSTAEEGYKEADIIVNGKTEQALGGGNCQVSTTLYNAVLASNGLTVTEHHDHGKKVPYIEEGKDATVAYNSLDLKFKNDLPNTIKMYVSTDGNTVTVKIVKIS